MDIQLDGHAVSALVDTGAAVSCIRHSLVTRLKKVSLPWTGRRLYSANGDEVTPIGICSARVTVGDTSTAWEFCILQRCPHDVILGWDFLSSADITINCGESPANLEVLPQLDATIRPCANVAMISEDARIPPRTIMCVAVDLHQPLTTDAVLEPHLPALLPRDLFVPRSLIQAGCKHLVLPVLNAGHVPHVLPQGMKLASVAALDSDDYAPILTIEDESDAIIADDQLREMIDSDLSEPNKKKLLSVLRRYSSMFACDSSQVGRTTIAKHRIDTGDNRPVRQPPYRVSFHERRLIQSQVQEMLENDVITPSSSSWASPVVLVKKKEGTWRFCVDYRRLNKLTKKDVYPLPRIDDALDRLQGATYFSSLDMASGYWQVEVDEQDREKTAFITPDGLYEFQVMPFGLCNAPATFQRMMDLILAGLKWTSCLVYLDDIVVFSATFDEHLERLDSVLQCIHEAGLTLKPSKCKFASRSLRILGHVVDADGIQPDPDKLRAVSAFPRPTNVKEVRSFLGLCSYYRRFVPNFARRAHPLTLLTQANVEFQWTSDHEDAFQRLKKALLSPPVLAHYNDSAPTSLHTDASSFGIGAVLTQAHKGRERVISYASRALSKAEKNYSTTEKECLAVIWAIAKFRPYLYGRQFSVVTDHHALCWLANLKDPNGRLARWALRLQEFDVTIVYKSGKRHSDADCLSRAPVDKPEDEDDTDFLLAISPSDVVSAQQQDSQVRDLVHKLHADSSLRMKDGLLLKKNFRAIGQPWLIILPPSLHNDAFESFHDAPTAGHLGISRTWDRVRRRFYWPGLYQCVKRYVNSCRECQRRKRPAQQPAGLLQPIPPADYPFQRVGIDLLGRFPSSENGNRWIVVCTDYFTRYAETKALPSGSAEEIAKFLLDIIILRHGAPSEILSDRGASFLSHIVRSLEEAYGISRLLTSAYHPQTNGLTERLNRTLVDMLSMYVSDNQKDWDEVLPSITFAYNTAQQETTGYSPYFLLYGRDAKTPLDAMLAVPNDEPTDPASYAQYRAEQAEGIRQVVTARTLQTQRKSKARYDTSHRATSYTPGDLVWVWTPIRRVGLSEKLLRRYFGPYRVIRQTSDVNYLVEPINDTSTSRRRSRSSEVVHVSRMKPYISREAPFNNEDSDEEPSDYSHDPSRQVASPHDSISSQGGQSYSSVPCSPHAHPGVALRIEVEGTPAVGPTENLSRVSDEAAARPTEHGTPEDRQTSRSRPAQLRSPYNLRNHIRAEDLERLFSSERSGARL